MTQAMRSVGALSPVFTAALRLGRRVLDDLFATPAARGHQASKQLIAAIVQVAKERNWSVIRWLTADNNYRARSSYHKIASPTKWITYNILP